MLIYRLAPSRPTKFSEVWIGALAATGLIWAGEWLFLVYAVHFAHFNMLYGTLGGVMAFLLWVYLSSCVGVVGVCFCAAQAEVQAKGNHNSDRSLAASPGRQFMNQLKQLWSNPRSSLRLLRSLVGRATHRHLRVWWAALSGFLWWGALTTPVMAQGDAAGPQNPPAPKKEELSLAPEKVAVRSIAHDEEIRQRLQSVMEATGWFIAPQVAVVDGVVFLNGGAESDGIRKWAGDLARNTQDVVAVANRIEVFLASIFLSIQHPFETGDLVEIVGVTGYVQQLNIRTTVLLTLDGNLVQVPNAAVYKSTLQNFTATPNRRENFVVGIGYDDVIDEAQGIALKVLVDHPAILQEPEPWVLVDDLGQATVNLRIYFWINGHEHSGVKVRSSVIRLVKRAFQQHRIRMPDEAREVVFPRGVPVTIIDAKQEPTKDPESLKSSGELPRSDGLEVVSTKAEAGLSNEAGMLEELARQAKPVDEGENLLGTTTNPRPAKAAMPGDKEN